MKVAIVIDCLIERDNSIMMLELLLSVFEDATIYTLVHKKGAILGQVEMTKIKSSFLSNIVTTKQELMKKLFLIPSALENLKIDEDTDLVITLSSGLCHEIKIPEKAKHLCYIYEWDGFFKNNKLGWKKIFKGYVNSWRKKTPENTTCFMYSSKALRDYIYFDGESRVLPPVFNSSEFHFEEEGTEEIRDFYLVQCTDLSESAAEVICEVFETLEIPVKFFGKDGHLEKVKKRNLSQVEFLGDFCTSTEVSHILKSKAYLDLAYREFPFRALGAMACGKPVIVLDNPFVHDFVKVEHGLYLNKVSYHSLKSKILEMEQGSVTYDRKNMRRDALKLNGRIFKRRLQNIYDEFIQ
jgi:glycosyltransferase involved in cell wall biosynthesis